MVDLYRNYEDLGYLQKKINDQIYELEDIFNNKQDDWDKKEISRLLGEAMPIRYGNDINDIIPVSKLPDGQLFVYVGRSTEPMPAKMRRNLGIKNININVSLFEFEDF